MKETITITPFDILDAFKDIKCGKSCGVDDISAEHFVYAQHRRIYVLSSLCFLHSFHIDIYQIILCKRLLCQLLRTSDRNNYSLIALVTTASKIFELC